MPVNLELKIKVDSHNSFKRILKKIDAEKRGILNQKDIYYSVPNGLLKLRIENGSESLIYYNRNEAAKNRWSDYHVAYMSSKGSDKLFSSFLKTEVVVEKKRELYYYDDTRIHLDTVKHLGKFLELETLVLNGKADAQKRFGKIKELLNLNDYEEIRSSYRDLLIKSPGKK